MRRSLTIIATGIAVGVGLLIAGEVGPTRSNGDTSSAIVANAGAPTGEPRIPSGGSLSDLISSLQSRLESVPDDSASWATLGLAYVQQAKVTIDPSYYPKADGALARSLEIDSADNFLAYAGLSALASARHDFSAARDFAEHGLKINDFSAILHGALSDAQLQLGDYDAAFASVQRMIDLSPDTASLARASYTWELRGDIARARTLMQRALDDAPDAADRAFALVHLGTLSLDQGDANTALASFRDALVASPTDVAALAGKARAEAAIGQTETAIDDYATLVARAPEPGYVVEFARLLESAGRTDDAAAQYDVFAATQQLFTANGVEADSAAVLVDAERCDDPARVVAEAEAALERRPFLDMYDAYAWALHCAGRNDEAMQAIRSAMELGTPNARYHFHAGMIALSLGDDVVAMRELNTALAINPEFDPLSAPVARAALLELQPDR